MKMGRLQRERDRDSGAITGYIFDGQHFTVDQFRSKLGQMLGTGDAWAQKVVDTLPDFQSFRSQAPKDRELLEAEIEDLNLKLTDPDVSEVDRVHTRRRKTDLEKALAGMPSAGSVISDTMRRIHQRDVRERHRGLELSLKRALGRDPTDEEFGRVLGFMGLAGFPQPFAPQAVPQPQSQQQPQPRQAVAPQTEAVSGDAVSVLRKALGRQPTTAELQDIRSAPIDLEQVKKFDEQLVLRLAQLGHPAAGMEMRRRGLIMPGTLGETIAKSAVMRTVAGVPIGLMSGFTAGALQPEIARVAGEEQAPELTRAGKVAEIGGHMVGFFVGPYKIVRPLATPVARAIVKRVGAGVAPAVLPYVAALSQGLSEGALYGVLETMAADFDTLREIQRKRGTAVAIGYIAARAENSALTWGINLAAMHGLMDMIRVARLGRQKLRQLADAVREGVEKQ